MLEADPITPLLPVCRPSGRYQKSIRIVVQVRLVALKTLKSFWILNGFGQPLSMRVRYEIQLSGEATGSPVVTDGRRRNYHNFCTYCAYGLPNTAPDGFKIQFSDGHTRRLLRLARGPFRYRRYAASRRSGDMGCDVRFRRRGAPAQATVADDSL